MQVPLNLLQIFPRESQEERVSTNILGKDAKKASKDVEPPEDSATEKKVEEPSTKNNTKKRLDHEQI